MSRFAFISRHKPTEKQVAIATLGNIQLIHVGDRDAFTVDTFELAHYDGAIVVHPAMAMRLSRVLPAIGVFANINRAPIGQPPQFDTDALHLYYHRTGEEVTFH